MWEKKRHWNASHEFLAVSGAYREFAAPVLIVRPAGPLAERARDISSVNVSAARQLGGPVNGNFEFGL